MAGRSIKLPLLLGAVNESVIALGSTSVAIRIVHNNGLPFFITHLGMRWPETAGTEINTIQIRDTQHNRLLVDGSVTFGCLGRVSLQGGGNDWFPLVDPVIILSGQSLDCNISAVGLAVPAKSMCVFAYGYQIAQVMPEQGA